MVLSEPGTSALKTEALKDVHKTSYCHPLCASKDVLKETK